MTGVQTCALPISTEQEDGNVEVGEDLELLTEEVEGDGQDSTQRETPQEAIVDGARTEHLFRTESTPQDGSREKHVGAGAGEVVLLRGQADVGDLGHLVVENGQLPDVGNLRLHLRLHEGDPRRDVHVVGELEILSEVESLRGREISVSLEVVQSDSVTREPETAEELGNNVQGDLDVRDGHDDAARDAEDHSEENCRVS